LPEGANVGTKRSVRPQTNKGFLYVVSLNEKHRIVDKKCTDTQRLFGACGKCTKFICENSMWDFTPTVIA